MAAARALQTAGRQLCWLAIAEITASTMQPRTQFDDLELMELASSIRENGLLQPVTVRPRAEGYELILGERRLRACRLLEHTHIEAFVLPADDAESALLALVENVQRQDLHFLEEAQAYHRLVEQGMREETLARLLGKSLSAVSNRLRLLRLEPAVREAILEYGLSERHARALLPLPGEENRLRVARLAGIQHLSVQRTEALVAKALERLPVPAVPRRVVSLVRDHRLYVNAIRGIVEQMRQSGVDARCDVNEFETAVELRIVMAKGIRN